MTGYEILNAFKHRNEEGQHDSPIQFDIVYINMSEEEIDRVDEIATIISPEMSLTYDGWFGTITLKWDTPLDSEMYYIWSVINDYSKERQKLPADSTVIPFLRITAVATSTGSKASIIAMNPVRWWCCSSKIDGQNDQIQILFNDTDAKFHYLEDFDEKEALDEAKAEVANDKLVKEAMDRKIQENEENKKETEENIERRKEELLNKTRTHSFKISKQQGISEDAKE